MDGLAGKHNGDIEWEKPGSVGGFVPPAIFLCNRCRKLTHTPDCQCPCLTQYLAPMHESTKVHTISQQVVGALAQAVTPSEQDLVQQQESGV